MKKFFKTKAGRVDIAGLMDIKKVVISTTIPNGLYQFAKQHGLKFSFLLSKAIRETMEIGKGEEKSREELKELVDKWRIKFDRLQRHLIEETSQEIADKFIYESQFIDNMKKRLKDKSSIETESKK